MTTCLACTLHADPELQYYKPFSIQKWFYRQTKHIMIYYIKNTNVNAYMPTMSYDVLYVCGS